MKIIDLVLLVVRVVPSKQANGLEIRWHEGPLCGVLLCHSITEILPEGCSNRRSNLSAFVQTNHEENGNNIAAAEKIRPHTKIFTPVLEDILTQPRFTRHMLMRLELVS